MCLQKNSYLNNSKVAFDLYYRIYPTGHEAGQVFRGLHEDPLTCGDECPFQRLDFG